MSSYFLKHVSLIIIHIKSEIDFFYILFCIVHLNQTIQRQR
jgi:hypothetical protein